MLDNNLELALIGNCRISALVNKMGEIVWCCMPRFDSDPVFASLLKSGAKESLNGTYGIDLDGFSHSEQEYQKNTAILKTTLYDQKGSGVVITDFAPRLWQYGRTHRPVTLMRMIQPIGSPKIRIRIRPADNEQDTAYQRLEGSNHIKFIGSSQSLRLTADISITSILDEKWFILDRDCHLIFGSDESIEEPITQLTQRFLHETEANWRDWVCNLAIPFEWQDAVIRSAITLKLSAFEDTGAIVAAMTTSIPEAKDTERNWDYRFCWLRDSYFTVHALNRLGVTGTMEQYLHYLVNLAATVDDEYLQPVFCINGDKQMEERIITKLDGYRGMGPVRFGNQAADQIQHDVYGAIVLSATQMFFDERIRKPDDKRLFPLLEEVGEKAVKYYNQPDAGLWELRGSQHIHTFSSMMCWAAADRLAKIAETLQLHGRQEYWQRHADTIRSDIDQHAFNTELNSYTATWGGDTMDASLLLACSLGYVKGDDPRFIGTVESIEKQLRPSGSKYVFRYVIEDDFGAPENAFTICSFWYIEALAAIGRVEEARALFEDLLERRNHVGLLSEDIDPVTGELWGNFPQTYSMVGIINCARILSQRWEDEL
ncbi:Glucoamylase (glucan-1,4-alpha-glucosidase), GH15 family [Vibrio xiamenensis]|uniref:Glucoamylase (Glucan-1,4-alpha-glucosidase), GH15 family n=1 Tax=Vibrio xiamenensis TaxID=861298 RepID=A0A1G8H689_9VIBR|nr:glycoside hydrolase family 15 protein [Vibrio xiamenensis]SDI02162.1 Glucoamylase (glucan-1,4-alpha-glucosidase), GH15 family [Vibrio xiamenensis]